MGARKEKNDGSKSQSFGAAMGLLSSNNHQQQDGNNPFLDNSAGTDHAPRLRRGAPNKVPSNLPSNHDASGSGSKKKKKNGARPVLPLGLAEPLDPVQRGPCVISDDYQRWNFSISVISVYKCDNFSLTSFFKSLK